MGASPDAAAARREAAARQLQRLFRQLRARKLWWELISDALQVRARRKVAAVTQ